MRDEADKRIDSLDEEAQWIWDIKSSAHRSNLRNRFVMSAGQESSCIR